MYNTVRETRKFDSDIATDMVAYDDILNNPLNSIIAERKEKLTSYFVNLPSNEGFLPLESVEYLKIPGVVEQVNEQIKTTKIETKKITDAKLFEIPKEYIKLAMPSVKK